MTMSTRMMTQLSRDDQWRIGRLHQEAKFPFSSKEGAIEWTHMYATKPGANILSMQDSEALQLQPGVATDPHAI